MTEDIYIVAITALLPLTACMLVCQTNPYHSLIIRGIMGAVAALVYTIFGAADVALTEALVGTMLSITLYAIAVRSSMNMRVGILTEQPQAIADDDVSVDLPENLLSVLRQALNRYHTRLELVPYLNSQDLQAALESKEIHTAISSLAVAQKTPHSDEQPIYQVKTRLQRLYEIIQPDLPPTLATLTYVDAEPHLPDKHSKVSHDKEAS